MEYAGVRVVVAEDDPAVRMVIAETLIDAGLDVLEAADGMEARHLIEAPDHIALIVTDLNMPGSDGISVAKFARKCHPGIPVLFVSARPELVAPLPFPYRYLTKPFKVDVLAEIVGQMLKRAGCALRTAL